MRGASFFALSESKGYGRTSRILQKTLQVPFPPRYTGCLPAEVLTKEGVPHSRQKTAVYSGGFLLLRAGYYFLPLKRSSSNDLIPARSLGYPEISGKSNDIIFLWTAPTSAFMRSTSSFSIDNCRYISSPRVGSTNSIIPLLTVRLLKSRECSTRSL